MKKGLCYKSSLTHPKCTKSQLQRSRFQKIPPLLRGPLRGGGRGWGGRGGGRKGRGGERGRNVEGPGKWSAPGPALALGGPGHDHPHIGLHASKLPNFRIFAYFPIRDA